MSILRNHCVCSSGIITSHQLENGRWGERREEEEEEEEEGKRMAGGEREGRRRRRRRRKEVKGVFLSNSRNAFSY